MWIDYKITDFADIENAKRIPLSSIDRSKRPGEYPYYGASGIIDYVNDFIFEGEYLLVSEDGENLKSRQTPIAFIAKGKFWVNNHAHILKFKNQFHAKLFSYYFNNLDLNPFLTGAVQPKLNKAALESIPIVLPDNIDEQKAIASILSSLDDKIDLLHRQNATLEAMAETLFRQWFVEEATEEWEGGVLSNICNFFNGKPRPIDEGTIPVYGGNGILGYSNKANYSGKSIIIGRVGAYCGSVYYEENEIWVSDNAILVQPINIFFVHFLFYFFKYVNLNTMAEGSSHPLLTQTLLKNIELNFPLEMIIIEFYDKIESFRAKQINNNSQIRTLTSLRDTLLPKLMSGEVRVSGL